MTLTYYSKYSDKLADFKGKQKHSMNTAEHACSYISHLTNAAMKCGGKMLEEEIH